MREEYRTRAVPAHERRFFTEVLVKRRNLYLQSCSAIADLTIQTVNTTFSRTHLTRREKSTESLDQIFRNLFHLAVFLKPFIAFLAFSEPSLSLL
jgi:hypothetical protein